VILRVSFLLLSNIQQKAPVTFQTKLERYARNGISCGLVSIFLVNNQKRDAGTEPSLQEGSFTFVRGWFDILKFVKSSNAL